MLALRLRAAATALLVSLTFSACDNADPEGPSGVTAVRVTAPVTEVTAGGTLQLQAAVEPAAAPQGVTWATNDAAVAVVDGAGLVTGMAPGTVRVTATSTADPQRQGTVSLTVIEAVCPTPRTIPGGAISADQTWENWVEPPECVDYVVDGGITNQGALITIEPGVRAAFEGGRSLVIRGDDAGLRAAGTAEEPIVLTGLEATRGYWGAVWLDGTEHPENRLEHVTIEYGGDGNFSGSITQGNLILTGGSATTLQHVTLRESAAYGLSMASGAALRAHGQNTFTANAAGPARVYASQAHFLDATSSASGNDVDYVDVYANDIEETVAWVPMGDGYRIEQQSNRYAFDVSGPDGYLTLEPGVRIVFQEDMAMTVQDGARLFAFGTAAAPIVLSGEQPTRGFWRGLRVFSSHPGNRLAHLIIEHGGGDTHSGSVQPGNLFLGVEAAIRVTTSTLREGAGYGLVASDAASLPDFNANVLTGNALGAAYVRATVAEDLTAASVYTGNDRDVIDVYAYVSRLNTPTLWEDLGVPYVITGTPNGLYVDDTEFTVGAGAEIQFQGDVGLSISGGTLTLQGTQQNPVRLTGADGPWKGVEIHRSTATFNHTTIARAGTSSWGSVQPAGAVTINTASGDASSATFGPGTTHTDTAAPYGLVFGPGSTTANCQPMEPVYIPQGDTQGEHCR